jgi:MFS family permease
MKAESPESRSKAGIFDSLQLSGYRYLWFSGLCATFAMQMQMVGRGWLVYDMTSSALALTWVMLSFLMPSVVFSLIGGVLADRVQKKSIMIYSQVTNGIATALLAYIIYSGQIVFWHFIVFGLCNGTVFSLSMPARSALVPEVVGRDRLVNAMALQSATFNLSRILGPAIAGLLISVFAGGDTLSDKGVGIVFFIIAILYLFSAFTIFLLPFVGDIPDNKKVSAFADIKDGIRYLRSKKLIVGLLIMGFLPFSFGFSASFLLPAFNQDVVGGGPDDLGLLMTSMGVGALAGSLMLARMGDFSGKGRVMFYSAYLWAITLAGFAITESLIPAMFMGCLTGFFSAIFGALNMSIVQLAIDPEYRGRVMSMVMMTFGLMPLGVMPISILAEYIGIHFALVCAAALLILSMWVLAYFFPDLRKIDKGHGDHILSQ